MAWAETVYGAGAGSSTAERRLRVTPQPADAGSNPVLVPIPDFFKAIPAVLEAQLILQGRSISRPIPGRVIAR